MNLHLEQTRFQTRRTFFGKAGLGIGTMALGSLLGRDGHGAEAGRPNGPMAARSALHHAPKAKSVIYLDMSGAPPTVDLLDYKPKLNELHMQPCPESLLKGERFAFIKGVPKMLGSQQKFAQHGQCGMWLSDNLPHLANIADDLCVIRSMNTPEFNHAPAELFLYTGNRLAGSASMGSWLTYGLGTENQDLPGFVVLLSGGTDPTGGKSLWSSGFLPGVCQGVQCRTSGEPILFSNNPPGMDRSTRRRSLDALAKLNELESREFGDPETLTRIQQYELAFRMQIAVPEAFDITKEPQHMLDAYGAKPGEGSFANNCLLARRLVEQGVRYVQLYDWGWDMHGTAKDNDLVEGLPKKCRDVDQAAAALVRDLKQRGMLEDTLVVWGGEFGRTPMNEERNGSKFLGRDHHPHCFAIWMAGGGIKPGHTYGATDELGYFVVENKVSIHDLQATILHQMGIDSHQFSYRFQGLNYRLIGPTEEAQVVRGVLA